MPKLAGKVALITGGAGGQGVADAELMVREGAAVMLTDIDVDAGEALAARLRAGGGRVQFLVQDVADEDSWKRVVAATLAAFGGLHILVCRHDRPPDHRQHHRRGVELHARGQHHRPAPRHEALRTSDTR
jgi:NAD(P)-dependent dehydrogenase (short-subunit alcohol dehydrogenase family)